MKTKMIRLVPLSQCKTNWNFSPLLKWNSLLPIICWGNELLVGFDYSFSEESMAIDLQSAEHSPLDALKACHPHITLPELARLWQKVKDSDEWQITFKKIDTIYQWRWNKDLQITLEKLAETSPSFQDWCSSKQLNPQDLACLRAKISLSAFADVLLTIAHSSFSKSIGTQVLEWAVDLALQGTALHDILPSHPLSSPEQEKKWLNKLKKMRYPLTTNNDENKKDQIMRLPWPTRTQAQWLRQGDRSFLEIKLQIESLNDLHGKIQSLNNLKANLEQNDLLWKN